MDAIHIMEDKCKAAGIDISFCFPLTYDDSLFPYSDQDIQTIQNDASVGKARIIILSPSDMIVNGHKEPISIFTLVRLFKEINPFGEGRIFHEDDFDDDNSYPVGALVPGFACSTKCCIPNSYKFLGLINKHVKRDGGSRREAIDTVWDILLYYAVTGKRLLENEFDWTCTESHIQN